MSDQTQEQSNEKVITVQPGDTLASLCQLVYGNNEYLEKVAQVNNLNHYQPLTPGAELIFPPIAKG